MNENIWESGSNRFALSLLKKKFRLRKGDVIIIEDKETACLRYKCTVTEHKLIDDTGHDCATFASLILDGTCKFQRQTEPKKMTISEISKKLGYDIEIVKE